MKVPVPMDSAAKRRVGRSMLALGLLLAGCQATNSGGAAAPDAKRGEDRPPQRACTEIGCSDQASVRAQLTGEQATPGEHTFAIKVDGRELKCALTYPAERSGTELASATCDDGLSLMMGPSTRGIEERIGDTVSYSLVPIPGSYEWNLAVYGTPKEISVKHSAGDKVILERSSTFTYESVAPNGNGCEPVCRQATLNWNREGG